jgi:hypothetical protein
MKMLAWPLAAIWLVCAQAAVADQFSKVQCGGDIPKALIGARGSNERVVVLEGSNRKLGLKHLGADTISDDLSSINYLICGAEYSVLEDRKNVIRDAIAFPAHSRKTPAFSGVCQLNGKEQPGYYMGVLNAEAAGDWLPVVAAWKIDEKNAKLVKAPAETLRCSRRGIITVDGGL